MTTLFQNYQALRGYIFLCSSGTEDECLEKGLFGGREGYHKQTGIVSPGEILFLFNYQEKRLHGIFKSISESKMNIIPDAWDGDYPWQVKVERIDDLHYLTHVDFEEILKLSPKGFPPAIVSPEVCKQLISIFRSSKRRTPTITDYRDQHPAKIRTMDGHKVRSYGELTIDNWLFQHGIVHEYEPEIIVDKDKILSDFRIPLLNNNLYIEFWGKDDKYYLKSKEIKLKIYKRVKLQLLEVFPKDLEKLDIVISQKLKEIDD